MAKYIPLDAVLAEIEGLLDKGKYHEEYDCAYRDGNNGALYALKGKVNSLEVKEVDLEKEIEEHVIGMPMSEFTHESEVEYFYEWARKEFRYFFKLGLQASNPLTWKDVRDIMELYDDVTSMDYCNDIYEEVLKRFKAQKGE